MNTSNKAPRMIDLDAYIAAGIDPKTGLPVKAKGQGPTKPNLSQEIKKQLRIVDEQNAIHRYVWYNLPDGLNGDLIERILYYKGQGMLFYHPVLQKYYFLPFALSAEEGTGIDVYGRYTSVKPLPFNGSTTDYSDDNKQFTPVLGNITRKVVYDLPDEIDPNNLETKCVLLYDYCKQISNTVLPRAVLQDPILEIMAECFPAMRTNLINGTGVSGLRVNDDTEDAEVLRASSAVYKAAMEGNKWVPIKGAVDFQDLSSSRAANAEEYLLAMQSLDNYRLSLYGLQNGGIFQKKSHVLESEQNMNAGNTSLALQDGLKLRQDFALIANVVFGTVISCEINENIINIDRNGDGKLDDDSSEVEAIVGQPGGYEEVME